jgi:hypothetical protein
MTIRNAARCNECVVLLLAVFYILRDISWLLTLQSTNSVQTRLLNRLLLATSMEQIPSLEADNR